MSKKRQKPQKGSQTVPVRKKLSNSSLKIDFYTAALIVVILVISFIRFRLSSIPLERDEGEYAYLGKLITEGTPPYATAYNMKLPGTYFMYGLIMTFFGKSISGIHIGLAIMNAFTMFFFFLGFRKLFNPSIALFASSVYGLISLSPTTLGFAAHATHFVSFFVSLGIFFLARFYENSKGKFSLLTGLMFGMAFLMKQQAVFLILFGGVAILLPFVLKRPIQIKTSITKGLIYSGGILLPYLITVLLLAAFGAFDKFWFWTVEYASKYASGVSFNTGKQLFASTFEPMWQEFTILWVLFFAGIILTFVSSLSLKQKVVALSFTLFAFLTICPGFYFRQHYFISFLPAVGLLGGISLYFIQSVLSRYTKINFAVVLPVAVLAIVAISAFSQKREYYFKAEPDVISRRVYGTNPFPESVEISKYIENNSQPGDKVAVLGSEPQIYFYSNRASATGYIYTYGLMEIHDYNKRMQEEMIAEIEKNKPKFLVFCNVATSWLSRPESPQLIFDWFNKYIQTGYELTGVADIVSMDQTVYKWGNDARNYQIKGKENIMIFRK